MDIAARVAPGLELFSNGSGTVLMTSRLITLHLASSTHKHTSHVKKIHQLWKGTIQSSNVKGLILSRFAAVVHPNSFMSWLLSTSPRHLNICTASLTHIQEVILVQSTIYLC
jgi:hypothetical protein